MQFAFLEMIKEKDILYIYMAFHIILNFKQKKVVFNDFAK